MPTLRSSLDALASSFADSVLVAIRGASLDELLSESGAHPKRGPSRPRGATKSASESPSAGGRRSKSKRLPRRSAEEITGALEKIVALVKKTKEGLPSEQIRVALKMQSKELPRILKEGLSTKVLKAKGQKRATTYFAVAT
jgi:hypothetical protein